MKRSTIHDEPTPEDLQGDLERQYAKIQHDPETGAPLQITIFCPWCGKGNQLGLPTCCQAFLSGIDAIGRRQLQSVMDQLKEVRLGSRRTIRCPYCHRRVSKEASAGDPSGWPRPMVDPFCCDLMHDAALAIVEKLTFVALEDKVARIQDGLSKRSVTAAKASKASTN